MASRKLQLKRLKNKLLGVDSGSKVYYLPLAQIETYKNNNDKIEIVDRDYKYIAVYPERMENCDDWEKIANKYCLNLWKKVLVDLAWENIDISDSELKYVSLDKESLKEAKKKKYSMPRIAQVIDRVVAERKTKIAWSSLKGSQNLFLCCPAFEALYDGGRGFGKTDTLVNDFLMDVGVGWGNRWQGLLLRRSYGELKDVIDKTKRIIPYIYPNARWVDKPVYTWYFPDGEALRLGYLENKADYERYHGQEYQWIGVEEITLWEDGAWVDDILTCLRSPIAAMGSRLRFRATTNPFGAGRNWVKARYIDKCRFGNVLHYKDTIEVGDKVYEIDRTRACIFGNVLENETILASYLPTLVGISDPNKRKAHLLGSWDVVSGGLLDDLWEKTIHAIKPFKIPTAWKIDRSYDHGEGHPFSIGWWATADGVTPIDRFGTKVLYPAGTLFRIDEIYGAVPGNDKEGLRMSIEEISQLIKDKERTSEHLVSRRVWPGPAESAMWVPKSVDDSARKFLSCGIEWLPVNKKAGSRIVGKDLLRSRLSASLNKRDDIPGIYFFDNCEAAIRILPQVQRDENNIEDAVKKDGDDLYDEVIYKLLGPRPTTAAQVKTSSL